MLPSLQELLVVEILYDLKLLFIFPLSLLGVEVDLGI